MMCDTSLTGQTKRPAIAARSAADGFQGAGSTTLTCANKETDKVIGKL
ncbi:hypothetical protein ACWC0C_18285 [Streptomyces sp. NPDC001709]